MAVNSSSLLNHNRYFYSLSIGANWGDNLTPLGDNILVLNIAKDNNRPISIKTFWKFITTLYQLVLATLFFILLLNFYLGILILMVLGVIIGSIIFLIKKGPFKIQSGIDKVIFDIRNLIIA
jgi:hypothetical protein